MKESVGLPMTTEACLVVVGIACIHDSLERCGSVQLPGVCVTMRRDTELRTQRSGVARWIVEPAPNNTQAV